jgi:hypothetical protein
MQPLLLAERRVSSKLSTVLIPKLTAHPQVRLLHSLPGGVRLVTYTDHTGCRHQLNTFLTIRPPTRLVTPGCVRFVTGAYWLLEHTGCHQLNVCFDDCE